MRLTGKTAGLLMLGAGYVAAVVLMIWRTAEEARPDRVTIRVSQWQLEGGVRQAFAAMIRRYEQLNPRVHVELISIPDRTYRQWAQTQLIGGDAPDIVEYGVDFNSVGRFFSPITDEVMKPNPYNRGTPLEGVPWRDTFLDAMMNADGFNPQLNQYYAATLTQHSMRMIYNRPMLREITGSDQPPTNYREFLALCRQVQAYAQAHHRELSPIANSKDTVIGEAMFIFECTASGVAARIDHRHVYGFTSKELALAYLRGDWSFREPELRIGLELLQDLGKFSTPGFLQLSRDSGIMDFVRQRTLMVVAPSWEASSLKELCDFEIGAFRYPVPLQDDPVYGAKMLGPYADGRLATLMGMYVNRATKHRAEAIDFLHFITSVEGNQIFTDVSTWLPSVVGVKASEYSRQFLPIYDGYIWSLDGGFMNLSGDDAIAQVRNNYFQLWGPNGAPEKYRAALDDGMKARIISDLNREISIRVQTLTREDAAAAAAQMLAPGADAPVALLPARLEGRTYQMITTVRSAEQEGAK
ncbi:MAG TPA: extracellular solute-binding protein [Opitutaceae bacterium]|nr:extracellular solute-binding protein [Opitutaceae bacterium]HND62304.1 extracellular solute-binding protein [Opitutaceae bacterium]